jgi:hypothetical protein
LNSLYLGDGHKSKSSHILTTTSKKLADNVQELILKCGDCSRIYPARLKKSKKINSKRPTYEINWLVNSNLHQVSAKGLSKSSFEGLVDYNGKVYCVEVPNHIIYVRRNGIPVWCGNSLRFYADHANEEGNKLIMWAEKMSYSICEECGRPGKPNDKGWIKTLCDKCKKKRETKIKKQIEEYKKNKK